MRHRLLPTTAAFFVIISLFFPFANPPAALARQAGDHPIYLPAVLTPPVFTDAFNGAPATPTPWRADQWEVVVHSRDMTTWDALEPMQAGHGPDCSPPPATHPISAYADAVFQCRDHIMTAINASGYGAIVLTPAALLDFSKGEAVLRFDVTTLRTSGRDWIDLWITPYEDNLQIPLHDWLPDLNGEPRRGIHITPGFDQKNTAFSANVVRNFQVQGVDGIDWIGYEQFLSPSPMRRDTFELRLSRTHIKFGMPAYNFWWVDKAIPALDWSQGVVQLGHHSYTPTKDCAGCKPNTWHWDNFYMLPAVPFQIEQLAQRYVDANTTQRLSLPAPAPANAHLRFSGIGKSLQVSFDDGKTWVNAARQAQEKYKEEAFWTYWTPIPAGTTVVRFRGQDWSVGKWRMKDISVWSK